MNSPRWERIKALFDRARTLTFPERVDPRSLGRSGPAAPGAERERCATSSDQVASTVCARAVTA